MTLADLNRLRVLQGEIRRLDEKAQELRARAERLTSMLSGMPAGTREHDQLAGIVADLLDNERRAAAQALELTRACEEAELWLAALPEQQRRVMRLYYVDGIKTWKEVAEKTPYHYIHCLRIKKAALRKLENASQC